MSTVAINLAAWQVHAQQRLEAGPPEPRTAPARFEWTQRPNCGPSAELLGPLDQRHVVELGCGPGHNLAHLVTHHGAIGLGIDAAPAQIERARAHYGHLSAITFMVADATTFLITTRPMDVCISVFGAIGLTRPAPLLAMIAERLRPGGRLVFSVQHQPNRPERQPVHDVLALPNGRGAAIARWSLDPSAWASLVQQCGLTVTDLLAIPAPADDLGATGCLVVAAVQP